MPYSKNSTVFWLLCFVNLSNCIFLNFNTTLQYDTTQTILQDVNNDTGGTYETKESLIHVYNLEEENLSKLESAKLRVKRQSSGGKYTDAAKMPQVKVLRLFLQMFKNIWASVYVGGAHPFHHEVPKPLVQLFKDKLVEFFFPPIGEEAKKD